MVKRNAQCILWINQFLLIVWIISSSQSALSAPKKLLLKEWQAHNASSITQVDHSLWQQALERYVVEKNKQTYVNYTALQEKIRLKDDALVEDYIHYLMSLNPLKLTRKEQKAYWLNLYNAATVQLIVKHYPVTSITKVGGGLFRFGPWGDDMLTVNGKSLSLNDIEHGILRPIYDDPRIHYAVNCASFSCPNLSTVAFTANNTEFLLEQAARNYINHPRAVMIAQQQVVLSTIYDWYQEDFGGTTEGVIAHIRRYAGDDLTMKLNGLRTPVFNYVYDWTLNDWPSQ
ncbi:MAG: hypothetical protein ACI8VC_002004 [Candidatus Endobugula sp.]